MRWPAKRLTVSITADFDLEPEDVWPDGEIPDVVDAQAVKMVMERCGSKRTVLEDWSFLDELEVTVTTPNPAWRQDEVLFPEYRQERFQTVEVWDPFARP